MTELFGRTWELNLLSNPQHSKTQFKYKIAPDAAGQSLRVVFEINASIDIRYYSGTIKVYNLHPDQRRALAFNILGNEWGTGPKITFREGYDVQSSVIMDGVVFRSYTTREVTSGDWITHMQCGTALNTTGYLTTQSVKVTPQNIVASIRNWIDELLPQPVTAGSAIDKNGRFVIGRASKFSDNLSFVALKFLSSSAGTNYNKTLSFSGPISAILEEIGREFNMMFFSEYGKLNVKSTLDTNASGVEVPINSQTGMIGSPQYTDTGAKFFTFLRPDLKIFQPIFVDSTVLRKKVKILSLTHTGDSLGNDWKSEIDASNLDELPTSKN